MCLCRFRTARGHSVASVAQRWHTRCTRPSSRAAARVAMARRRHTAQTAGMVALAQPCEVQLDCGRRAGSRSRRTAARGANGHRFDSSDWVMVPNVYGMGLFSDGGIFATKPYICGSAYFMKMMDFKKGEWCNTMDGLYWRFIDRNRKFFLKNPRLSMMVRIFDKMKDERKKLILSEADKFIRQNTI